MQLSDSEKVTIMRALELYKSTIDFCLKNRKARRNNPDVVKMIDLYEQDLLNINSITTYFN